MLDEPPQNKMIDTPPAKKGWHFAGDGIYFAEFIEAQTIQEATEIYHRIKRRITPPPPQPVPAESTPSAPEVKEKNAL